MINMFGALTLMTIVGPLLCLCLELSILKHSGLMYQSTLRSIQTLSIVLLVSIIVNAALWAIYLTWIH